MWIDLIEIGVSVLTGAYFSWSFVRKDQKVETSSHPKEEDEVEAFLDPYRTNAITDEIKKEKPLEVIKWNLVFGPNTDDKHYRCPKCAWGLDAHRIESSAYTGKEKKLKHWPLCQCDKYTRAHFHFQCSTCGFNAIMKTKDDS